jgi:hypothetical protein
MTTLLGAAALTVALALALAGAASAGATTVWTIRASAAPGILVMGVDPLSVTGTPVLLPLSAATATATQWQLRSLPTRAQGDPKFQIYTAFVNRCISAPPDPGGLSFASIRFAPCAAGDPYAVWRLYIPGGQGGRGPVSLPSGSVTSPYWLRSDSTGECLWVPAAHYVAGQALFDTAPCSAAGSRLWRLSRGEI